MKTTAQAIDSEFDRRFKSGELQDSLGEWGSAEPILTGVSPERFCALSGEDADHLLGALVRVFQKTKHEDAALLLLKALLPGTLALASRVLSNSQHRNLSIDDVVAQVYLTLHRLPIENRPTKVAANILLDSRQRLARDHRRAEVYLLDDMFDDPELADFRIEVEAPESYAFDVIDSAMVVKTATSRFVHPNRRPGYEFIGRRVLVEGHRSLDVAQELGCPSRMVYDRMIHIRRAVKGELSKANAA